MAATGITAVRDALAALIDAAWDRDNPADEIVTNSSPDIDSKKHKGRKVYVLRSGRADQPATRGEDENDYAFVLLVVEKFEEQGNPPEEWIDERVAWSEWLLKTIGNPRTVRLLGSGSAGSGLWPEVAEISVVIDVEELKERKLFVSMLQATYREQIEP